MGALVTVTTVGTVLALGLGWIGRTRSKRNRQKILQLEQKLAGLENLGLGNRLARLEDFERETLEKIPLMLDNLAQMLSEFAQANPEVQSPEFQASLTRIRNASESARIIQEDLAISSRAAHWLKRNRHYLVREACNSVSHQEKLHRGNEEYFIEEVALLLALTARVMEKDMIGELPVIVDEWEKACIPKSLRSDYILTLTRIQDQINVNNILPKEDRTTIENYIKTLSSHMDMG